MKASADFDCVDACLPSGLPTSLRDEVNDLREVDCTTRVRNLVSGAASDFVTVLPMASTLLCLARRFTRQVGTPTMGDFPIAQTCCIVVIFFISGLTLKTADIQSALKAGRGLAYGIFSILGLTPMMGFLMVQIPFEPVQFRYGLALFCCVPTTLTSGVTLVAGALGNSALALMLTVLTNTVGVFTVPFILNAVLESAPGGGGAGGEKGDMVETAAKLLIKLIFSIIVPMVWACPSSP